MRRNGRSAVLLVGAVGASQATPLVSAWFEVVFSVAVIVVSLILFVLLVLLMVVVDIVGFVVDSSTH